jgi:hypothetical protein
MAENPLEGILGDEDLHDKLFGSLGLIRRSMMISAT